MAADIRVYGWSYTGETRCRVTWRGKVLLQVEERRYSSGLHPSAENRTLLDEHRWRDATEEDLDRLIRMKRNPAYHVSGPF